MHLLVCLCYFDFPFHFATLFKRKNKNIFGEIYSIPSRKKEIKRTPHYSVHKSGTINIKWLGNKKIVDESKSCLLSVNKLWNEEQLFYLSFQFPGLIFAKIFFGKQERKPFFTFKIAWKYNQCRKLQLLWNIVEMLNSIKPIPACH